MSKHPVYYARWYCVPKTTRKHRKRGVKPQDPYLSGFGECPNGGGWGGRDNGVELHILCGFPDALGRIIPWQDDPRNPRNAD